MRHFVFIFVFGANLIAAEVTQVGPSERLAAISHERDGRWELFEAVCLQQPDDWNKSEEFENSCGFVILSTWRGALVKFAKVPSVLKVGQTIVKNPNAGSSKILATTAKREAEAKYWEEMIPFYKSLLGEGTGFETDRKDASLSANTAESSTPPPKEEPKEKPAPPPELPAAAPSPEPAP